MFSRHKCIFWGHIFGVFLRKKVKDISQCGWTKIVTDTFIIREKT